MATYSNLSYGSSGDEVKKLQQSLINAGYDLGNADGIFGEKTQAAVKKYQQDNGLDVDGIAGTNTLGKLYGTTSTGTQQNTQQAATPVSSIPSSYDSAADAAYQQALAALQQASKETPAYAGSYDTQLEEIYKQITNRDKFSYDLNGDMLYQQYKDQYTNLGQMAMMDTMGQAAALTGGYGSSYSQAVGQQAYQGYLQQLNEVVPELYGMALDQYNQQGQDLLNQYSMVGDLRDDEYGKYQDQLNQYWLNVDYLKGQADDAYNRGYTEWATQYEAQQDAYNKLLDQMTKSGYTPTAEELATAGMTQAQADAYIKAWKASNPDLAYRTGAITPDEYYAYTGEYPKGYTPPSTAPAASYYYAPKKEDTLKEFDPNRFNQLANEYEAAERNDYIGSDFESFTMNLALNQMKDEGYDTSAYDYKKLKVK